MPLWNDLADTVFDDVGLTGFQSRANVFFIGLRCSIPIIVVYYFSLSRLSVDRLVVCGWGLELIGCISLSLSLALPTSLNITIIIIIIIIIVVAVVGALRTDS